MKNYRSAFYAVLIANIVLVGSLGAIWWNTRRNAPSQRAMTSRPTTSAQPVQAPAASPPPVSTETPLAPIQLSAERLQSIGVKFGVVERKPVQEEIHATGNVALDETRLSYVQSRIAGHIESVFVNATYQFIREGQPLFTFHSPELIAAEREYLLAKENAANLTKSTVPGVADGAAGLLTSARERLAQWNIPQREIERLESTGEITHALEIDSPVSGYVTERNALPNLMVQPDTRLYTVADLSQVWVLAQVFQNDLARVQTGAPVSLTLDSYPGRIFRGRVDFVYPDVDVTTRTARVRVVVANPNLTLKPGMYVNALLQVPLGTQLVIPASGVLRSGTRQIVFVDRGSGYLEPRDVELGAQVNDQYVVNRGLKPGERIVTSANFLVDSESQLQAAIGAFAAPPGEANTATATAPAAQTAVQVDFSTQPTTPQKGSNTYRVKLTSNGAPLSGAQLTVRSYMAAMPQMGMAAITLTTPLSEKSTGLYEAQLELPSGGTWQITITATRGGSTLVSKQLSIRVEGGM